MENLFSKQIDAGLTKLGIYQLIGGVVGLLLVFWDFTLISQAHTLLLLLYIVIALLFGFSIFCGVICLQKKKTALTISMVNQLLQIIGFTFKGYAFNYVAGGYFTVYIDVADSPGFSFGAGISRCIITINDGSEMAQLSLNIIATWVLYEILIMRISIKEQERDRLVNSLGENTGNT